MLQRDFMSESKQDKVAIFDTLFTTNHIRRLKVLVTYLESSMQKNMAVYIKFLELQYTMNFFRAHPYATITPSSADNSSDYTQIFGELIPYCDAAQRSQMENMQNMLQTFVNLQEMMEMVNMMKDIFPEGDNPLGSMFGNMDPASMPDMSQMFDMFQMFGNMKGGDSEDGTDE